MSLDDAKSWTAHFARTAKCCDGRGAYRTEVCGGIAHKAGSIDVVDLADRIPPSILDADAGKARAKAYKKKRSPVPSV